MSEGSEAVSVRVYGAPERPTLIYFPGLHGDWTLVGGFRQALGGAVRFVEMSYPRTLTWTLQEYAEAIERSLAAHGVNKGWLLGESFGSQLVWVIAGRRKFTPEGIILAGGFVRHPFPFGVWLGRRLAGRISFALLRRMLVVYAVFARVRYRAAPEVLRDLGEFLARRTDEDWHAARHRLDLLASHDPGAIARGVGVPVYGLSGVMDPIVPWHGVRRWLKRNCRSLRDYKLVFRADHTVLATAPKASAQQVLRWMNP